MSLHCLPFSQTVFDIINTEHALGRFSRRQIDVCLFFPQKTGSGMSCKLSPKETICMKFQILFSGKMRKYFKMSSAEN